MKVLERVSHPILSLLVSSHHSLLHTNLLLLCSMESSDITHVTAHLQNFIAGNADSDDKNLKPEVAVLAAHPYTHHPISEVTCYKCQKCGHYQHMYPENQKIMAGAAFSPIDSYDDGLGYSDKLLPF